MLSPSKPVVTKPGKPTFEKVLLHSKTWPACRQPVGGEHCLLFYLQLLTAPRRGSPKSNTKVRALLMKHSCHLTSTDNTSLSSVLQPLEDGQGNTIPRKLPWRQSGQPGCSLQQSQPREFEQAGHSEPHGPEAVASRHAINCCDTTEDKHLATLSHGCRMEVDWAWQGDGQPAPLESRQV